jgi:CubicO group peptidase (beta-lactamase class C family)
LVLPLVPPLVLIGALLCSAARAAPDELTLGREQGYPLCRKSDEQQCLVALFSRADELSPSRKVRRGDSVRPLRRAAQEPALELDHFLERNRNTGLLVLRDGEVLAERYQYARTPEQRFYSASMAKTVVAMLVGIALHENKIDSIDDRAEKYLPQLKGHPYGETPLRHLLTMSSGVKFSEVYDRKDDASTLVMLSLGQRSPGGVATVLPFTTRNAPPGTQFSYASGETQVLSLVLRAAVGQPLADYLSEKIWQPMGAEADASWLVDRGGYEAGYCCLNATLRDWARFGWLLAGYGKLEGRQIIPEAWVRAATTAQAPHLRVGRATRFNGYGYQTWLIDAAEPRFAALGVRGQAIMVDPKSKLVVVHTAVHAQMRDTDARARQFALWNHLLKRLAQ